MRFQLDVLEVIFETFLADLAIFRIGSSYFDFLEAMRGV
jgi:hypothetical protein